MARGRGGAARSKAFACVLGGVDLLRAVGMAGIPCASVSPDGAPTRFSRYAKASLPWHHPARDPEALTRSRETESA